MRKSHDGSVRMGVLALVGGLVLLAGCGGEAAEGGERERVEAAAFDPAGLTEVAGHPATAVRDSIRGRLAADRPAPLDEEQWGHAERVYARYGGGPIWFGEGGMAVERVDALVDALAAAHDDALRLDRYPIAELGRALREVRDAAEPTAGQIGRADLLLTATYVALGEDLLTGQVDPADVSEGWHIDAQEEAVDSALAGALREAPLEAAIAKMRPQDDDYQALKAELRRYRDIATRGDWPQVPDGRALKPGETDSPARLAALRARLRAEGFLGDAPAERPGVYDTALAGAVAAYQARHTIVSDSILGEGTVAALNTPPGFRMGQIAANLERHRWLPRSLGSRYILVNVSAFRLVAYEEGTEALEMRVIVGEEFEDRTTPVFSDSMEYVVFRPYWLVTDDIAAEEIFPQMRADPGFLARNDYELYESGGQTRVRQTPGEENSLGLVKFIFPNDFNVYLHDTPNRELFREDVRAFSHGCIRVEKPEELAQWVLGWSPDRVRQAMQAGSDDQRQNLGTKIPVYIAYFTTFLRDGRLHFGNDLYGRDDELIRAVTPGALPDAATMAALEALRT